MRSAPAPRHRPTRAVRFLAGAIALLAVAGHAAAAEPAAEPPGFTALCYHDVVPAGFDLGLPDAMPILVSTLTNHFDWLRDNSYTVIGVDDILDARAGRRPLPDRAVLLSFDDGFASFYHIVYPLLKAYRFKAVLALQTDWLETPPDQPVPYGDGNSLPRSYLVSWEQVREMAESGWVEIASHSHDLHRGLSAMPQQIQQPAATALRYDAATGTYESPAQYHERVRADLQRSSDAILQHTGRRPRVLMWPYGRYTQDGVAAAREAGFLLTASLGFFADADDATFPRYLIHGGSRARDIATIMRDLRAGREPGHSAHREPSRGPGRAPAPQRVVHVDIDMIHDPDPEQQNRNISALFDRIVALQPTVVYLQAFADPDGDGIASALYFPNRHLPMRADLFNYLSWQMSRRLGVEIYAWMPVLGFDLPPDRPRVRAEPPENAAGSYRRLSPFDAENRRIIREIYQDLARNANFSGLLFHDDALLGDYEDMSPPGRAWLAAQGLPTTPAQLHADPDTLHRFTRAKSRALVDFTLELAREVEAWRPPVRTARNLYAQVALAPHSETWFAQNLDDFLDAYDYTALMAMPYMENAADRPEGWLSELAQIIARRPHGPERTVFELQAVDWRHSPTRPIDNRILAAHMTLLLDKGFPHFGYYPENPIDNHPDVNLLAPAMSVRANPLLRRPYTPAPPVTPPAPEGSAP